MILRLLQLLLNAFLLLTGLLDLLLAQLSDLVRHIVPLLQLTRGSLDLECDDLLVGGSIGPVR